MKSFLEYLNDRKIILEEANEIKNELEKRFGNDLNTEKYEITTEDAKFIFDLLNRIVFKNKLANIEIYVEKLDKSKHTTEKGQIFVGRHIILFDMDSIDLNDPNFYPKSDDANIKLIDIEFEYAKRIFKKLCN